MYCIYIGLLIIYIVFEASKHFSLKVCIHLFTLAFSPSRQRSGFLRFVSSQPKTFQTNEISINIHFGQIKHLRNFNLTLFYCNVRTDWLQTYFQAHVHSSCASKSFNYTN